MLWDSFLHARLFLDSDCSQLFTVLIAQGCLLACCCLLLYRAQQTPIPLGAVLLWKDSGICVGHISGLSLTSRKQEEDLSLFLRDSLTTLID